MGVVYWARNRMNGLIYVGYTAHTLQDRRSQHESAARNTPRSPFQRALRQYGTVKFTWKTLYVADDILTLRAYEHMWIDKLRSNDPLYGYNTPSYQKTCIGCGKVFGTEKENAKYCCVRCKNQANYRGKREATHPEGYTKTKKCLTCGSLFTTTSDKRRYCDNPLCIRAAKTARDKARRKPCG